MRQAILAVLPVAVMAATALCAASCSGEKAAPQVVVYTSVDEVDARKVLDAFEKETGIKALPAFDTEASKTTGLAMRLLAEMDRPVADVFWNNELSRTIMLEEKGVLEPYASPSAADIPDRWKDPAGGWAAYSLRARVIVYNTDLVPDAEAPRTLEDLCLPRWKGKVAIANPLFGTTACHVAALADLEGEDAALDYMRRLKANDVRLYDGNSVVRDVVAAGEAQVGLTDTDDALLGMNRAMKIRFVLPDQEPGGRGTLVIPNSVAMVKGAPHPAQAERLIDFLLSRSTEQRFARPEDGYVPVRATKSELGDMAYLADVRAMGVDWQSVSAVTGPFSKTVTDMLLEK